MSGEDACSTAHLCSDGNGTDNDAIFQHHAENQENEVKQEHGGAQRLVHLPVTGRDGDDDKEKHDKEQHDCTEEPVTADGHRSQAVDGWVQQPRDGKPFETMGEWKGEGQRARSAECPLNTLLNVSGGRSQLTPRWCRRCYCPRSWTQPCRPCPCEPQSHW